MLKNLLASSQFNQLRDKNWSSLSKLIPGTTARQVLYDLFMSIIIFLALSRSIISKIFAYA